MNEKLITLTLIGSLGLSFLALVVLAYKVVKRAGQIYFHRLDHYLYARNQTRRAINALQGSSRLF